MQHAINFRWDICEEREIYVQLPISSSRVSVSGAGKGGGISLRARCMSSKCKQPISVRSCSFSLPTITVFSSDFSGNWCVRKYAETYIFVEAVAALNYMHHCVYLRVAFYRNRNRHFIHSPFFRLLSYAEFFCNEYYLSATFNRQRLFIVREPYAFIKM